MDRERERKILEKLDHDGYVKVSELSRSLGCTEVTLRRDLKHLDERGLLRRIHGGAVRIGSNFVRNNGEGGALPEAAREDGDRQDRIWMCAGWGDDHH